MTFNHKEMLPELIIVIWDDTAALDGTWHDSDEALELLPGTMHSVGWVLARTNKHITITSSAEFSGDLVGDVSCIPLGCIREIQQVLPPQPNPLDNKDSEE